MLRKVKMYGELADFVGYKELEAVVKNPAEAIRFLVTNFPKLEAYMASKYYQVLVGNQDIAKEELHNPIVQDDIHIVPVISGAGGGGGLRNILIGAALIGGAFLFSPLTLKTFSTTAMGFGSAAGIAKGVAVIGGALVLQGVSELLFPMTEPEMPEDDPRISFSFSGVQNTSRAGTAHPIVYGEVVTGSVVISAGIDTDQVQV